MGTLLNPGCKASDGPNMLGLCHDKTLCLLSTSLPTQRQDMALDRSWALLQDDNFCGPNSFTTSKTECLAPLLEW